MLVRKVTMGYYLDYTKSNTRHDFMCSNPIDSFKSLMQHLQVYEVNPYEKYHKAIRSGTARNGAERDRGHIIHLVDNNNYPSWSKGCCGIQPKGNGWHYNHFDKPVSCEKCLKKLDKAQERTGKWVVLFKPDEK